MLRHPDTRWGETPCAVVVPKPEHLDALRRLDYAEPIAGFGRLLQNLTPISAAA